MAILQKTRLFLHQTYESVGFAIQALTGNLLRTTLSLLGVTVGIFAIIAVYTLVDSLEMGIRSSLNFLGDKVIYVQKWPWVFTENFPWWKYINRPVANYNEFQFLEKNANLASSVAVFSTKGGRSLKYESNEVSGVGVVGCSYQFNQVSDVSIAEGRYFVPSEVNSGAPVMLIGHDVAVGLFNEPIRAVGKQIILQGKRFTVIGVMAKQGSNLLGTPSNDFTGVIPFPLFASIYSVKMWGSEPMIALKGFETDKDLENLEGEVKGLMRAKRGLKPKQEDSFAINRPEMIAGVITSVFAVVGLAGTLIGGFSILVGGFGIANIMFVSVRERTNLIGIQKSLGATNYFILLQFLAEAVFLSLIGGLTGLLLVYGLTFVPQDTLEIVLTMKNITTGLAISIAIGIVAGIAPALMASRMNPVDAIRSK